MGVKAYEKTIYLFLLFSIIVTAHSATFDVRNYGAKANAEVGQALAKAWTEACAAATASKVYVPAGTYPLSRALFMGPCKAPIQFQLEGTLQAPSSAAGFKEGDGWVTFERITGLTVFGGGVFDGNGEASWGKHCDKGNYCGKLPINIRFNFIKNSVVQSVTSLDSKQFHIQILGAEGLTFHNMKIIAPASSYNTDGIHIGRSTGVNITDSNIQTGDDCISVGDGTSKITVSKVTCGPGHGISVGSLGLYSREIPVVGVTVRNCTFKGTSNGVRVKTWPASVEMSASDLHFDDLIMENVGYPVLIDQEYCPNGQCNNKLPSKVKLNRVSFKNVRGTASTPEVVKLICSATYPCQNVEIGGIDLSYKGRLGPAKSICKNVTPKVTGSMNPAACTAKA